MGTERLPGLWWGGPSCRCCLAILELCEAEECQDRLGVGGEGEEENTSSGRLMSVGVPDQPPLPLLLRSSAVSS